MPEESMTRLEALNAGLVPAGRRLSFLRRMEACIPWDEWRPLLGSLCGQGAEGGESLLPGQAERLMRMHLIQIWYGLSDEDCVEAVCESLAFAWFAGIDPEREAVPDAAELGRFCRRLDGSGLAAGMSARLNALMAEQGICVSPGAVLQPVLLPLSGRAERPAGRAGAAAKGRKGRKGTRRRRS